MPKSYSKMRKAKKDKLLGDERENKSGFKFNMACEPWDPKTTYVKFTADNPETLEKLKEDVSELRYMKIEHQGNS